MIIFNLPPGLDRSILLRLSQHLGRPRAISRLDLLNALKDYHITERQLRIQIRELRRMGYLIGSAPGADGGYYLITSADEFNEFLRTEYQAKINDMRQTVSAMSKTASRRWGAESLQFRLFT